MVKPAANKPPAKNTSSRPSTQICSHQENQGPGWNWVTKAMVGLSLAMHLGELASICDLYYRVRPQGGISLERPRRSVLSTTTGNSTYVEFVHPKLAEDLAKTETASDPWIWLTSVSRIPVEAMQEFCSASKEYCPPGQKGSRGDPGAPGLMGLKGRRGRPGRGGEKGLRGHTGLIGPPGPRGIKGHDGIPGISALDGRDGLPGEPGLDGIPGRNGIDGLPGLDGIPGIAGVPGKAGEKGHQGEAGDMGPMGPKGQKGEIGLPGPRGKQGKEGQDGVAGEPGVGLWKIGDMNSDKALIPPRISRGPTEQNKDIVVREGDNLRLTCAASGIPQPHISWNRLDGNAIPLGAWRVSNSMSSTLNITRINRQHIGIYVCEANNGLPPSATRLFNVLVHFSPLIRIHSPTVGGYKGSFVRLQCIVEAFPLAVHYWERHDGMIIQNTPGRYEISTKEYDIYKTLMSLNVTLDGLKDFGAYYCISKNERGLTKGAIEVFERDPNFLLPPPLIGGIHPTVIGEEPPEFLGIEDLCPPPKDCPDCKKLLQEVRCEGAAKIYGLDVLPYDSIFPGLPNRTADCLLNNIGKPVFHRYSRDLFGHWMQEASVDPRFSKDKVWVTNSAFNQTLFEFGNKTAFKEDTPSKNYTLPVPYTGNDNAIFNGSFFYFHQESESIVRFDLATQLSKKLKIPRNRVVTQQGGSSRLTVQRLYGPQQDHSVVDFSPDENGMWAVMGLALDNHTLVMKFDPYTLAIEYMWNISLSHHQVADTFVVCGVLYAIDHVDVRITKIRFALDLYENKLLDIELPFTNPFRHTTSLQYNPRLKSLITWDSGNQLTYPVKFHYMGDPEDDVEEMPQESEVTGYEVMRNSDKDTDIQDIF